jgi:hypothetical protein
VGVLLSSVSAGLGMFREILLVYILGFSKLNDILQIYLALYFVISLFADPLRLTYLNLITTRPFRQVLGLFLVVMTFFILAFAGFLYWMKPSLNPSYLFLAAFDGLLGIFAALLVFHKQRFGAYLSSQVISVLPSLIMFPAIIALTYLPQGDFVLCFLLTFFVVHTLQLFLLSFIHVPHHDEKKLSLKLSDLPILFRHCISILGDQIFQIVGRFFFFQVGQGFVTLISLFMKCFITFRFVFVDSYIGTKISTWDLNHTKDRFFQLINKSGINFTLVLITFFICVLDTRSLPLLGLQLIIISAVSFYFSTLHRIVYFKLNRNNHYSDLVTFTGLLDLFSAVLIFFCYQFGIKSHVVLFIYFWYIFRLYIETLLLRYFSKRLQPSYPVATTS